MKFTIDSKTLAFNGKGVKPLFQTLNKVCEEQGLGYLVVGAFARDLVLHNLYGRPAGILTKDIDLGILLPDWSDFNQITDRLINEFGYQRGKFPHVFITPDGLPTDLLPFGEVEDQRGISFPETDHFRINMMGFAEAWKSRLTISLDGEEEFSIATPEGLVLLKLIAWKDRTPSPVALKHVTDISLILDEYFNANADQLHDDPVFADIYDLSSEDFNMNYYGAVAIGRKIGQLIDGYPETKQTLRKIFDELLTEKGNFFRTRMGSVLFEKDDVIRGIIQRFSDELR
jgi:predicted nucleotidyltransferase